MAEMKPGPVGVELQLTAKGAELARRGIIKAPVEVTPELLAKREAATVAARVKSAAAKKARIAKLKAAGKLGKLPPMTAAEKRRTAELAKRKKAHAAKAAEVKSAAAKPAKTDPSPPSDA